MIPELKNLNSSIDLSRRNGVLFEKLIVTFKSKSKKNIVILANTLDQDKVETKIRYSLFSYKLICELNIAGKFNEAEYQRIVGKFFILASKCYVELETIGLK